MASHNPRKESPNLRATTRRCCFNTRHAPNVMVSTRPCVMEPPSSHIGVFYSPNVCACFCSSLLLALLYCVGCYECMCHAPPSTNCENLFFVPNPRDAFAKELGAISPTHMQGTVCRVRSSVDLGNRSSVDLAKPPPPSLERR